MKTNSEQATNKKDILNIYRLYIMSKVYYCKFCNSCLKKKSIYNHINYKQSHRIKAKEFIKTVLDSNKEKDINELNLSILFWKYLIFKLYKFYPSNKSLQSLIQRLEQWKNSYDTREINKKTKIIIKKNLFLRLWRLKEHGQMSYEFANESDTQIKTGTKVETH